MTRSEMVELIREHAVEQGIYDVAYEATISLVYSDKEVEEELARLEEIAEYYGGGAL